MATEIIPVRAPLVCNCRMVLRRGVEVQVLTVKARSWDCPSCGLDKRRTLRDMINLEECRWLLTLTYRQPHAVGPRGEDLTPEEHANCDRTSHVYRYVDGTTRWRTMASCRHCCRRRSWMLRTLVKRLRRLWGPQFNYLAVVEDQKNGSMHLHLALSGVPDQLTRYQRVSVARSWTELGGGYSNFRPPPPNASPAALGWYLGKYLAKKQDQRMARGYRRWTRAAGFAAAIRMRWVDPLVQAVNVAPAATKIKIVGWRHPTLPVVSRTRVWISTVGYSPA